LVHEALGLGVLLSAGPRPVPLNWLPGQENYCFQGSRTARILADFTDFVDGACSRPLLSKARHIGSAFIVVVSERKNRVQAAKMSSDASTATRPHLVDSLALSIPTAKAGIR
jgi:hypothetical protein